MIDTAVDQDEGGVKHITSPAVQFYISFYTFVDYQGDSNSPSVQKVIKTIVRLPPYKFPKSLINKRTHVMLIETIPQL